MAIRAKLSIEPLVTPPVSFDRVLTELRRLGGSERLLALYELGLEGCMNEDADRVAATLRELMDSLDDDYVGVAAGFRRVYEHCLMRVESAQYDSVAFVLQDLRDTIVLAIAEAGAVRAAAGVTLQPKRSA
jgi:hypothetical protein